MSPTQPLSALRDFLLASPPADRIALARELLAGTGRVDAPEEPSVPMLQDGYDAGRASRHSGVSGQTINASVRAATHRERAIYRAMLAARDTP